MTECKYNYWVLKTSHVSSLGYFLFPCIYSLNYEFSRPSSISHFSSYLSYIGFINSFSSHNIFPSWLWIFIKVFIIIKIKRNIVLLWLITLRCILYNIFYINKSITIKNLKHFSPISNSIKFHQVNLSSLYDT